MLNRHNPLGGPVGLLVAPLLGFGCPAAGAVTTVAMQAGAELAPPSFQTLASDDQATRLTIELPALAVETLDLNGEVFQTVMVEDGQLHGESGQPALPAYVRYVAIPATSGVTLQIASVEEETLEGFHLLPMQTEESETFEYDQGAYQRDAFIGGDPVTIGAPSLMRDLRVVPVVFHPVRFNPVTGQLKVVRRVELALEYSGVDLRSVPQRAPARLTSGFNDLYRSLVVNYDPESTGRSGIAPHLGTYVIISYDNAQVTALLQPLIQWRSRMGFNVVHATTAQTGPSSTSIRTWLQTAYTTWDDPPEYIALVGDATGSFPLPTFTENYSSTHGQGDHPYSQLTGDDLMPDAYVGRISAEDLTTLERIVYKINSYEQTPYMTDTNWFTSACLTGDRSSSGISCVHIMQWIKERLREDGFTCIDTVFSGSYEYLTLASLNQGRSFFAYRGWLGMSGISSGDIASLTNGPKLTYAVIPTCGSGTWYSGTSQSEAWIRGGVGTTNITSGIGGVGTATSSTHTRYNNCFLAGVAHGIVDVGAYRLGANYTYGKIELVRNYEVQELSYAGRYCYWNTLIADPATELWTGVPRELVVSHPASVARGANVVSIAVADEGAQPIEGAWVYLSKGNQIRIGGWTDASGSVQLPIDTGQTGEISLVVSGHNLYPYQSTIQIVEPEVFVGLSGYTIEDGPGGDRDGNGDGVVNPGETFDLGIALQNFGTSTAQDIELHVRSADPNLGWLGNADVQIGDIAGGQVVVSPQPVQLRLYPGTPPGHILHFTLEVTSGLGSWTSLLDVPVSGAELVFQSANLIGFGTSVDPGESGEITVVVRNIGLYAAQGPVTAMLASESYAIRVVDAAGSYGTIVPDATASNAMDTFRIMSPTDCIPGQLANLRLELVCSDGIRLSVPFTLPVGTADANDPTGPDAYGYWCYDQTDTGYPDAPHYQWIDINPASGGPGTSADLTDYGSAQDDSRTLNLPFTFTFYGQPFDRVTVCSNGWLAMGHTYVVCYRNWYLPSAEGPANMIAGFWDDLVQSGTNKVYYWSDTANHRFVVAWDRVVNDYGGGIESFEIILYDPAYYPTVTGDGIIDVMYEQIQDTDGEQMYSTAGIQNADHSTGITFCYYARRPATAASYANGLALRYTTGAPGYSGVPQPGAGDGTRLLLGNVPNPWSGATTIRFELGAPQPIRLVVFDLDGRCVRTLHEGLLPAGPQAFVWTGADEAGVPLPAGVYFYRLETPERSDARRMLLLR